MKPRVRAATALHLERKVCLAAALMVAACGAPDSTLSPQDVSHESSAPAETLSDGDAVRPHIVLFILDTLRADRLGSYGYPAETSPALDELAARGVVFERVLAQSSWTRPSVASFLTSRYPRTLGIYRERSDILADSFETLAEALKGAGYRTLGLTANPNINAAYNFHQGFDEYVDSTTVFDWMPQTEGSSAVAPAASILANARELLERIPADAKEPVYLQLNLMDVHEWTRKRDAKMIRPEYAKLFGGHEFKRYLRLTRQLTDDVAGFIEALGAEPRWKNTLFAIVSDHGEGLGDHPAVQHSRYHGVVVYASQLEVPWILYRPGWSPTRSRISQEVSLLDLMPTLLDLVDLPVPQGLDGHSLRPLIDGGEVKLPKHRVAETQLRGWNRIAVYDDNWAYIHNRTALEGAPTHELQVRAITENGVVTDRSAEHPEVLDALRQVLAAWERERPPRPATARASAMSEDERRQLEALGYLESEADRTGVP